MSPLVVLLWWSVPAVLSLPNLVRDLYHISVSRVPTGGVNYTQWNDCPRKDVSQDCFHLLDSFHKKAATTWTTNNLEDRAYLSHWESLRVACSGQQIFTSCCHLCHNFHLAYASMCPASVTLEPVLVKRCADVDETIAGDFRHQVHTITEPDLHTLINATYCAVLLVFASTSQFSVAFSPVFLHLSRLFPNLPFYAIDIHSHAGIASRHGIVAIPQVLILAPGRQVWRYVGTEMTLDTVSQFLVNTTGHPETLATLQEVTHSLPLTVTPEFDYLLVLAWLHILLVVCLHLWSNYKQQISSRFHRLIYPEERLEGIAL